MGISIKYFFFGGGDRSENSSKNTEKKLFPQILKYRMDFMLRKFRILQVYLNTKIEK